jgi:hypothetical protein
MSEIHKILFKERNLFTFLIKCYFCTPKKTFSLTGINEYLMHRHSMFTHILQFVKMFYAKIELVIINEFTHWKSYDLEN